MSTTDTQSTFKRVSTLLRKNFPGQFDPESIQEDTVLADLYFDSLAIVEFALVASTEFEARLSEDLFSADQTIAEVVKIIDDVKSGRRNTGPQPSTSRQEATPRQRQ